MREVYRVFVEDVGPGCFSAFGYSDVMADSSLDAIFVVTGAVRGSPVGLKWSAGSLRPAWNGARLIALPVRRRDLWPHAETGRVPDEALEFWKGEEPARL